jgi:hypothetical protein
MIDCFIRIYASNELRLGMSIATVARWKMEPDVRVILLRWQDGIHYDYGIPYDQIVTVPDGSPSFATRCQKIIEEFSDAPVYASTDDDALIYGPDFVKRGLTLLEANSDVGYLVSMDIIDKAKRNPEAGVYRNHSLGAPGFSRRGLIKHFPDMENKFWSIEVHRQMQCAGMQQAVATELEFMHLGRGYSIGDPSWWTMRSGL